jgi:hypothetical protein
VTPDGITISFVAFDDGEPGGYWSGSCHDCSWSEDTLVEDGREELAASAARHRREQYGRGEPYSRL